MTAFLIKTSYPCCNSSSRFDKPRAGQTMSRACKPCGRRYTVSIVKAAVSGRYGVPVIKAVWESRE